MSTTSYSPRCVSFRPSALAEEAIDLIHDAYGLKLNAFLSRLLETAPLADMYNYELGERKSS